MTMMAPFENVCELITFISLFIVAVAVIPYIFMKIGDYYDID